MLIASQPHFIPTPHLPHFSQQHYSDIAQPSYSCASISLQRMLIAQLIGGAVIFASFLLRMPQASSTLSLFLTTLKSVAPVSFLQQIEDAFSSFPAFTDSPSFYSDIIFSPAPAVPDLVNSHGAFQHTNPGSAKSGGISSELAVTEEEYFSSLNWSEKPVSTSSTYFNLFFLLAPPCAALTLYLTYVSCLGHSRARTTQEDSRRVFLFQTLTPVSGLPPSRLR